MAMDHGGKDYRSYVAKQYTQVANDKVSSKKKRRQLVEDLMNEGRKSRNKQVQLFQMAVKTTFLTAQMSA